MLTLFTDPRGALFFEIARLAEAKRPSYLLLENVPGLLSHDQGRTFAAILSTLVRGRRSPAKRVRWGEEERMERAESSPCRAGTEQSGISSDEGYHVEWSVLNSAAHNVPRSRRRLFLICYLDPRCAGKILPVFGNGEKALIQLIGGPQGYRLYDVEGVACTQTAGSGGTGAKTGLYLVDLSKGAPERTEIARCLTARYGQTSLSTHPRERSGVLLIKEATKRGYKEERD